MEDRGPGGPPPRDVHQPASLGATLTSDEPRVSVVVVDNDLHTVRTTGDTEKPDLNGLTPWQTRYQKTDEEMGLSARPTQSPNLYRMGLPLCSFVRLRFPDPDVERDYQREGWYTFKPVAILCSLFYILFWVLTLAFVKHTLFVDYSYVGICGFCTVPLPLLIFFDIPKRVPWLYQLWLAAAAWCWGVVFPIEMVECGFFGHVNTCGARSFLFSFASLVMLPTLALTLLGQSRIVHIVVSTAWFIFGCALYMTQPLVPVAFVRNLIILEVYHLFLAVTSYYRDRTLRQLFSLRNELKEQNRAVQAAQLLERKATESKKQFVSYIFHEVRVPLNTALLAAQNLEAEGLFESLSVDHRDMIDGLMGSLDMMEKVLNDVLSFNRMEAGNLEQARKPFDFHKTINIVALLHRVHAEHAGLHFDLDLDPHIDELGGLVVGDEMRLRQVTSNLISNALKFTQVGGVRVRTKLVWTSANDLQAYPAERSAAIRVEVHDTGVGLRPQDVENNRLFSPYVQTEIGRRQGGKGSGLGLALVYQIIRLSGGRLGIESTEGKGSIFWFEIPYTLLPGPSLSRVSCVPSVHPRLLKDEPSTPSTKELPSDESKEEPVRTASPVKLEPHQLSALVVDDDALTRRLMGRMLQRLGHGVAFADNGSAAFDMIRASHDRSGQQFDIVFLDNQMPVMSGVEVARAVREMGCGIRIVGCTGNALEEDQIEYLAAGADGVCAKPIRQEDVVAQLASMSRKA